MKLFVGVMAVFMALSGVADKKKVKYQVWTRAKDSKKIKAKVLFYNPITGMVKFKLSTGKIIELKAEVLTQENQDLLTEKAKKVIPEFFDAMKPRMQSIKPEGFKHKIHIYKPKGYVEKEKYSRHRVIIFLYSPVGKSKTIVNKFKKTADELGWVLLGVDAYANKADDVRTSECQVAYDWAKKNLFFSPGRVLFGGFSGGGAYSFWSTADIEKNAAGVISLGGWLANDYTKDYSKDMAVAIINGKNDTGANTYVNKDSQFLKKEKKAKIKVLYFPGGHVVAPPDVILEGARFIHETKKFGDLNKI